MTVFDSTFYVLGTITLIAAVMMAAARTMVRSVLALLFTFLGIAGIFVLLSAELLAVVELLVFAGGMTTLLLFGVALTTSREATSLSYRARYKVYCCIVSLVIAGSIGVTLWNTRWITNSSAPWNTFLNHSAQGTSTTSKDDAGSTVAATSTTTGNATAEAMRSAGDSEHLGALLLTDYLLPFEVIAFLLLVSIFGGVIMMREEKRRVFLSRPVQERDGSATVMDQYPANQYPQEA